MGGDARRRFSGWGRNPRGHKENTQRSHALCAALEVLDGRERRVFEARRLRENPPTLPDLAREFAVSPERIRQIELRAFEKVRRAARSHLQAAQEIDPVSGVPKRSDHEVTPGRVGKANSKVHRRARSRSPAIVRHALQLSHGGSTAHPAGFIV
jgi:hypothetical protein